MRESQFKNEQKLMLYFYKKLGTLFMNKELIIN